MKKRYIIAIISLVLFIILTVLVLTNSINTFDDNIYNTIFGLRNNILDAFNRLITELSNPIPVIIIYALLVILLKRNDEIIISANLLSTLSINQILKRIFRRPRPDHVRLIKQGGFSYPSGHAMMSLCLYGILIYICVTKIKNKKLKILLVTLLTIIILLIGISRIYLGVHYPSDIIGGYLLTIPILITSTTLTNNYLRGKNKNDKDGSK